MQRVLPRFFLLLYLFTALLPGRVVEELEKLPQLVTHYQEHKKEISSTTLRSFLVQHYGTGFARHQSEHNHNNLPGKDHQTHFAGCGQQVIALPERCTPLFLKELLPDEPLSVVFSTTELPPSQYLSGIWQPPKTI
jgi:hypothetical protein